MRHVLSSEPHWRFVKGSYAAGAKAPNVSFQKYAPGKNMPCPSKKFWHVEVLDISDLDKDATSLLEGCEANSLLSVYMNPGHLSCIMNNTSIQLKTQYDVRSVFIVGGTDEDDVVSQRAVPLMFAFMARAFPNVDRIVLHFAFAMPCKKEELQELYEVRSLQRSFFGGILTDLN